MNASERNAVDGVRVLWPHLTFHERVQWISRLRHLFSNNPARTIRVLGSLEDVPDA